MRRSRVPALVVLAIAGLTLLLPLPEESRAVRALLDLGHLALFGVLAFFLERAAGGRRPWLLAFLAATAFGALSEAAQHFTGRDPSVRDFLSDAAGAAAALLWVHAWRARTPLRSGSLATAGAALLLLAAATSLRTLTDVLRQQREFPLLGSFEHAGELGRWEFLDCTATRARAHATQGSFSLRLALRPGRYPGANLSWPPADWSSAKALRFDAYLEGAAPLSVHLKVRDEESNGDFSDRFEETVTLAPGSNRIVVPLARVEAGPRRRKLDLHRIAAFEIYTVRPRHASVLYLDDLRLTD